jgi:hypothetical protein
VRIVIKLIYAYSFWLIVSAISHFVGKLSNLIISSFQPSSFQRITFPWFSSVGSRSRHVRTKHETSKRIAVTRSLVHHADAGNYSEFICATIYKEPSMISGTDAAIW